MDQILANNILPNLFLGDWNSALVSRKSMDTLCVIETHPEDRYPGMTYYIPIMEQLEDSEGNEQYILSIPPNALIHQLDECCKIIDRYAEQDGEALLVHCYAGVERSPLTIAYWLVKTGRKRDFYEAYRFLKTIRPVVEDRTEWLPFGSRISLEDHNDK